MAGKKGRSGRRKGSLSWSKNPTAVAGHHVQTLIEMWLAGVPIKVSPDQWLVQPIERKQTVSPKLKRVLAQFAIGHMLDVRPDLKRPGICELNSQVVDFVKTQRAAAQPAAALDLFCANGSIPQVIAKTC